MGGKHKQAQRTKNNARPANSGRTAELLGSSNKLQIGVTALKNAGHIPAMHTFMEDPNDPNVNQDFQLVLKKMSKKDATTKLKALHEFGTLCQNSEPDAVKAILPFWPRLFCVLATDLENRVREAAHWAHRAVVNRVGRNIAPYLKQLIGPWFTGQYDTYPPAASTAKFAFQEAFSTNKMTEAIIFCQEEILKYISTNLLDYNPKSFCIDKLLTEEEMVAKFQRVTISSLHGYSLYLARVPEDQLRSAEEKNKQIVSSSKFWDLAKHEVALVRAAWFSALISICQNAPFLLENESKNVGITVFGNIDESDPTVLPVVWEAALHSVVAVKDLWVHEGTVNLTCKKLWNVLREGGQGNASVIFPNLLPLLSKIPSSVLDKKQNFYSTFFENMRAGLMARSIQQSAIETEAVVSSFMECIRYVILINKEDRAFCKSLLNSQIFSLLEKVMTDPRLQAASETMSLSIAQLLHYWSRQSEQIYEDLISLFWNKIDKLCSSAISNALLDIKLLCTVLDAQSNLLIALRFANPKRQKKQLKVKFSDNMPSQDTKGTVKNENETNDICDPAVLSSVFENSLYNVLNRVLKLYIKHSEDFSKRTVFVKHISKLVCKFDSEVVFRQLCDLCGGCWETLYNERLMSWLKGETVLVEYCLSIIFSTMKYVKQEEKQKVLEDLSKVQTNFVLQWCVQDENSSLPAVREWLQSDQVSDILINVARNVVEDELNVQTLKKCFTSTENRGLLISTKALYGIINEFSRALAAADTTISVILCISNLMCSLFSQKNYSFLINPESCLIDLLLTVFKVIVQRTTVKELVASWKNSVQVLSKVCGAQSPVFVRFTKKCANCITETMNTSINPSSELGRFVNHTTDFIHSAVNCFPDIDESDELIESIIPVYKIFVDSLLAKSKQWEKDVIQTTFDAEYISGKVYIKNLKDWQPSRKSEKKNDPLNNIEVVKYATCIMFPLQLLDELCKTLEDEQQDACKQNFVKTLTDTLVVQPLMLFAVCRCFECNFSATKQFFKVINYLEYLDKYLKDVVEKLDSDTVSSVVGSSFANVPSQKTLWYWLTKTTEYPELYKAYEKTAEVGTSQTISILPQLHPNDDILEQCIESLDNSIFDTVKLSTLNLYFEEIGATVTDVAKVRCTITLEKVMNTVEKNRRFLLDLSDFEVQERTASLAEFLRLVVEYYTPQLTQPQWDFCVISTSTWIDRIYNFVAENNRESVTTLAFVALAASVCRLFDSVSKYLSKRAEDDPIKQTRQTEWNEVLVPYAHKHITNTWRIIADWDCSSAIMLCLVGNMGLMVSKHVTYSHFANNDTTHTWWLEHCCKLLESPVTSIQITAYHIILILIPSLVAADSDSEGGLTWLKVEEVFKHTQTVVDTMLLELRFGDTCIVEAFTDSYTYARGYLLMWCAILEHCAQSNSQIRSLYTAWLKEDYLPVLMKTVFCLMPEAVVHCYELPQKRVQELFGKLPDFISGVWDSNKLAQLSCYVYACALRRLPAAIRQWWTKADHKMSAIVDKVTTLFVSPSLSAEEIRGVKQEKKFDNMTVIVHPTAREIVAVYTIEESSMELIIQLAPNHPLGLVKVDSGKCMVSTTQTRQWLLQLAIFLTHQNGSIWDGLVLWKSSLDKRFEDVEECYICFAILHNPSHQLPKLSCHTCRKKFHSHCLYKWFTTSNKSTCPICRNTF